MKIFIIILFAIANISIYSQNLINENTKRLEKICKKNDKEGFIEFKDDFNVKPDKIFKEYKDEFELSKKDSIACYKITENELGQKHYRYHQYYKGIKIEGAEFILHYDNDKIKQ